MSSIVIHSLLGLFVRLCLIIYGEIHDQMYVVQYTDVDYRVFTDAARYLWQGKSPFERHTYRYTPLLATILLPNIILHPAWGKLIFSVVDVGVGLLVYKIVMLQVKKKSVAVNCSLSWLYNPLAIVICTRGNADSISAALVLLTLLLVQKEKNAVLIGICHGVAIHVRLYPIAFSLSMYLAMAVPQKESAVKNARYQEKLLPGRRSPPETVSNPFSKFLPNRNQLLLVSSCVITLFILTLICCYFCGYQFLYESFLYHLGRQDIRHNFSVYFYVQYLSSVAPTSFWQRLLTFLPQALLLFALSYKYKSRQHLPFCMLTQAIVIVAYNPVMTSQYFIWFLSLVPPCVPHLLLSRHQSAALTALWLSAQLAWLLPAYWLEFQGRNTFIYIWLQGIAFFCANIAILAKLIGAYRLDITSKHKRQ